MSATAQLLIPALRADADGRFATAREQALAALALGAGGFVLYGGEQDAVRALTKELQQRSRTPLLIGADLERGAGQQFTGATGLPPLAALAWLGDAEALRRAARLTAREARTMGVNWDHAPVVDLDFPDDTSVGGTRSLGTEPASVARMAAEWITACQAEGVLACAKHFPGHGRAPQHVVGAPSVVGADRDTLHTTDLLPFRAAIDAGVASMMTAHAAFPALDPSGVPATYSRELLQWLLRQQMRYDNLIVAYGPAMVSAPGGASDEGDAAVRAIAAGCDLVVAPADVAGVVAALDGALADHRLDPERVRQSGRRRLKWAQWASPPNDWRRPTSSDTAWGAQLADRVVHAVRSALEPLPSRIDVRTLDAAAADDAAGRGAFLDTLRTAGFDAQAVDETSAVTPSVPLVVAVHPGPDAEYGSAEAIAATGALVRSVCDAARDLGRRVVVVLFAHPRLVVTAPDDVPVVCAWTGDAAMQRAAARSLAGLRV